MNEYELREVTRLVGESLVDLDVEDGSDVIVVAGVFVDARTLHARPPTTEGGASSRCVCKSRRPVASESER